MLRKPKNKIIINIFSPLALFFASSMLVSGLSMAAEDSGVVQTIGIGGYVSQGDYGYLEDTDLVYLPLSYEIAKFPWRLRATVPYLSIEGPGGVLPQAGQLRPRQRSLRPVPSPVSKESGLGDITLQAAWQPESMFAKLAYMEFSLLLKIPSADETLGLGTGETDLSTQVDLFRSIDSNTWFATLGYTNRGKTSLYDLKNSSYVSVGMQHHLSTMTSIGIRYDYSSEASVDAKSIQEITPFISWLVNDRVNYSLFSTLGMTDSSAELSAGFQINWSFP